MEPFGRVRPFRQAVLMALLVPLVLASCATTRNSRFVETDSAAQRGEFATAASSIDAQADDLYSEREALLYYLDSGALHFYAGNYPASIERLEEAERLIEELYTVQVSKAAATFLLNDNAQNYAGEDFEDIYLNVFKAVSFLEQGSQAGAFVEVRRIDNKLNILEDKYVGFAQGYNQADDAAVAVAAGEVRFYKSALARYLSLLMYRSAGNYSSARIDLEEIREAYARQGHLYDFPLPLDDSAIKATTEPRLSVISFAGRAPLKRAETLRVVTGSNMVYIQSESENAAGELIPDGYSQFAYPGVEEGYRFKFQLPRMELRGTHAETIVVFADGERLGELHLFESIERIAQDIFEIRQPLIFVKTVTRAITKGILAERGKEEIRDAAASTETVGGWVAGFLGSVATDVATDASEQADLRVSRYFPANAYIGEWELPEGTYRLQVEYHGSEGLLYRDDLGEVSVTEGNANVVSSVFHD